MWKPPFGWPSDCFLPAGGLPAPACRFRLCHVCREPSETTSSPARTSHRHLTRASRQRKPVFSAETGGWASGSELAASLIQRPEPTFPTHPAIKGNLPFSTHLLHQVLAVLSLCAFASAAEKGQHVCLVGVYACSNPSTMIPLHQYCHHRLQQRLAPPRPRGAQLPASSSARASPPPASHQSQSHPPSSPTPLDAFPDRVGP